MGSNTYEAYPGKELNIPPTSDALLLARAELSETLQEIARNPAVRIDTYVRRADPEASGLLLDVFWSGKKKTISFSEEELLDDTQAGRGLLREKMEKNIIGMS